MFILLHHWIRLKAQWDFLCKSPPRPLGVYGTFLNRQHNQPLCCIVKERTAHARLNRQMMGSYLEEAQT